MSTERPPRRARWQVLALVAFCLALLSKESALTVLPLYWLARRGAPPLRGLGAELRCLDWLPIALCAVVWMGLRMYVTGALGVAVATGAGRPMEAGLQ